MILPASYLATLRYVESSGRIHQSDRDRLPVRSSCGRGCTSWRTCGKLALVSGRSLGSEPEVGSILPRGCIAVRTGPCVSLHRSNTKKALMSLRDTRWAHVALEKRRGLAGGQRPERLAGRRATDRGTPRSSARQYLKSWWCPRSESNPPRKRLKFRQVTWPQRRSAPSHTPRAGGTLRCSLR